MPFPRSAFSGFPFDDDISDTGSDPFGRAGLRSHLDSLAARHPEFAQHLGVGARGANTRPANNVWGSPRKRRGSGSLGEDDARSQVSGSSGEEPPRPPPVRGFPFDDFPNDFRQHIPEDFVDFPAYTTIPRKARQVPQQYQQQVPPPQQAPPKKDFSTQTDDFLQQPSEPQESPLKQYGLRNTVDLGQKTQPALEEEAARGQRSMSAPPEDNRNQRAYQPQSQGPQPYKPGPGPQHYQPFKSQNQSAADNNMGQYISGGQKNPVAAEQQNHQKSGSPRPQSGQPQVRHIPIFVEGRDEPVVNKDIDPQNLSQAKNHTQQPAQESPKPKAAAAGVHHGPIFKAAQNFTAAPRQATPPRQTTPPPPPVNNDPISKIQNIQKDVLELMSQVEVFRGTRQEKQYVYLDEMLTRNLLKLDDVETEGKENIRQARKEAIKCIQKCIAVLEAKADSYAAETQQQEMVIDKNENSSGEPVANAEQTQENKQKPLEENSQKDITSNGDTSKADIADTPPSNENKQETASNQSQPITEQQAMEVDPSTTPKPETKPSQ